MQTDEAAIRAAIHKWHEYTANGNVEGVLSLMTDDVMFLIAGKPAMCGKAAFENGLRGALKQAQIQSSPQVEEVLVSGDLACARTQLFVKMIPHDGSVPVERHGPTLTLFWRSGTSAWLLKRDANLLE